VRWEDPEMETMRKRLSSVINLGKRCKGMRMKGSAVVEKSVVKGAGNKLITFSSTYQKPSEEQEKGESMNS